ncbi:LuxR C-terminal-related transcriptional regulator [Streptomyces sp. NPDC014894]|uniref:helix-turn-helix transcriptional regulator n=1 Tax=Streptomyces sp. NPDC014894 TaxID=3364931 RepID=UPI0036F5ED35
MENSLLERDAELTAVAQAGASAVAGDGRWLLLRGTTGMGLTSCVTEAVRHARANGMRVAHARGCPQEADFPFGVLRQLFPEADTLPFACSPPAEERQRIFHGLTDELAAHGPALLVVEAAQHADEASFRWLRYLTRRLGRLPVLLLLSGSPSLDIDGLPGATGQEMSLAPLSDPAVAQLAAARGHGPETARLCAHASAGSPKLLHALLADLSDGPAPLGLDDLTGSRYRDAMTRWLAGDSLPGRRETALALALVLAPGPVPHPDVPFLAGMTGLPLGRQAEILREGPSLERLLSHPLAREAVLAGAADTELGPLRLRAARQLYERGANAAAVAAQLAHLPRIGEAWMPLALEQAADQALREGSPDRAVQLLRRAVGGPLTADHRTSLVCRLGSLELFRSAEAGTRRIQRELQHAAGPDRLTVASALSGALVACGHIDPALRVLREVGERSQDSRLIQTAKVVAAGIAIHDPQQWRYAVEELRTLARDAPASLEPLVCGLLTAYDAGVGSLSAHRAVARVRARLGAPVDPLLRTGWLGTAASLLQWADRLDEARALTLRGLPDQPELPDLTDVGQQFLVGARATASLWGGYFQQVIDEYEPVLHASLDRGVQFPHLLSTLSLAHFELGHRDTAWQLFSRAGADSPHDAWPWDDLLCTRARLYAAEGRWQEALDDYRACGIRMLHRNFHSPVAQPWRSGAAHALVALGRPAEAVALADEELRYARSWGTPRVVGRALHARARAVGGRRGLETLTEAVGLLRASPAVVELTEALLDLGRAQIEMGRARKGRETLREAYRTAQRPTPEHPPLPRLVRAAEQALALVDARAVRRTPNGVGSLTEAERRIVDLAARGLTNAQIGASLHLARRTVETHLTHAYRKLGVTRRAQLTARLLTAQPHWPDPVRN